MTSHISLCKRKCPGSTRKKKQSSDTYLSGKRKIQILEKIIELTLSEINCCGPFRV
jgi:hypothetical protein